MFHCDIMASSNTGNAYNHAYFSVYFANQIAWLYLYINIFKPWSAVGFCKILLAILKDFIGSTKGFYLFSCRRQNIVALGYMPADALAPKVTRASADNVLAL